MHLLTAASPVISHLGWFSQPCLLAYTQPIHSVITVLLSTSNVAFVPPSTCGQASDVHGNTCLVRVIGNSVNGLLPHALFYS